MDVGWGKAGSVLAFLAVVVMFATVGYFNYRGEQAFKKQCVAVGGRALYDNDSDLECYRNGIEIAEHGKSRPK